MANEVSVSRMNLAKTEQSVGEKAAIGGTISIDASRLQEFLIKNRRLVLFATSALMMAAFLGLIFWSADPPYRPLFAHMDDKTASEVIEILQKERVPYRLEGEGTVLVPADRLYETRLLLAGKGVIPENGTGFELFDKNTPFGLSDFAQKVNYQRALQGELARTISVLPQVSAARVHLVLPKESAFIGRKSKASASVMLQISGGARLGSQTISAIQNLVAASVPGLEKDDVTVVDSAGNLLSGAKGDAATQPGDSFQEYKIRYEQRLEDRLTGMLEQIVGVGQAVVRVTATLDPEQVEQSSQRFNPDETVALKERVITERRLSKEAAAAGVPGMTSNIPLNAGKGEQSLIPTEDASREERVSDFAVSSTTEKRIIPPGRIVRLSVAAVVGGTYKEENGKTVFVPRSNQELEAIRNLLMSAMGYDEERGDTLEVRSMPLVDISDKGDLNALESTERMSFYLNLARYVVAGLGLVILAWFVLRPLAHRLTQGSSEKRWKELAEQSRPLAIEEGQKPEVLKWHEEAKHLVAEDPSTAAKIVSSWVRQS